MPTMQRQQYNANNLTQVFDTKFLLSLIMLLALTACGGGGATPNLTPFITTWKTDNPGTTADTQIKIGTRGSGYSYTIDWGDGNTDSTVTGDITHDYATAGTYTVSISGDFPQIYFEDIGTGYDNEKLLSIEQWGDIQWQSMRQAFFECSNLVGNATDVPDLSAVTDMSFMFEDADAFNQDIGNWDVAAVTDMRFMFSDASAFNQPIGNWNVSAVTDMRFMFGNANAFNQDIGNWDVAAVTNMRGMFNAASAFNQPIGNWNVSAVTRMSFMFENGNAFNQDIGNWDVAAVTNMTSMFRNAATFTNQNLSGWNVSNVPTTEHADFFTDAGTGNTEPLWIL